jgi:hypothetical protein
VIVHCTVNGVLIVVVYAGDTVSIANVFAEGLPLSVPVVLTANVFERWFHMIRHSLFSVTVAVGVNVAVSCIPAGLGTRISLPFAGANPPVV